MPLGNPGEIYLEWAESARSNEHSHRGDSDMLASLPDRAVLLCGRKPRYLCSGRVLLLGWMAFETAQAMANAMM